MKNFERIKIWNKKKLTKLTIKLTQYNRFVYICVAFIKI